MCTVRGGTGGVNVEGGECDEALIMAMVRLADMLKGMGINIVKMATRDGKVLNIYLAGDGSFYAMLYRPGKETSEEDLFTYLEAYAINWELERLRALQEPF